MSNPWGKPVKNWADQVGEDEKEEQEEAKKTPDFDPEFPTLGEAVKLPKAKKDKKKQTGLEEATGAARKVAQLEEASGRGYGDREGGRERRGNDEYQPSRADETSDWGSSKKFTPSEGGPRGGFGGGERRQGGSGFGERPTGAADEAADWGGAKKFVPSEASRGGAPPGFRDGPRREPQGPSKADEEDQWSKGRAFQPSEPASGKGTAGGRFGFGGERPSAADESDRWSRRGPPEATTTGAWAAPGGRPRLTLQPRSKPADEADQAAQQPKKSNPFGAARPREEVLKEKGIDYHKEELKLEHGEVIRDETPEERALKLEVEQLRKRLELVKASGPDPESIADEVSSVAEDLDAKETELYKLQAELDDKVRFAKAASHEKPLEREGQGGDKTHGQRDGDRDFRDRPAPRESRDRPGPAPGSRDEGAGARSRW